MTDVPAEQPPETPSNLPSAPDAENPGGLIEPGASPDAEDVENDDFGTE